MPHQIPTRANTAAALQREVKISSTNFRGFSHDMLIFLPQRSRAPKGRSRDNHKLSQKTIFVVRWQVHVCILENSLRAAILARERSELLFKNLILLISFVSFLQSANTISVHTHVISITYIF